MRFFFPNTAEKWSCLITAHKVGLYIFPNTEDCEVQLCNIWVITVQALSEHRTSYHMVETQVTMIRPQFTETHLAGHSSSSHHEKQIQQHNTRNMLSTQTQMLWWHSGPS